jgi:hypothetical protein
MPDPRIFTLDEAEKALPLVRRIVADIQAEHQAWAETVATFEVVAGGAMGDAPEPRRMVELREAAGAHADRIAALLEELGTVGCEVKDLRAGLVDFYALLEDRLVYLCWRMGEERITHWHEIDAGFAGRQPIDHALFPGTVS